MGSEIRLKESVHIMESLFKAKKRISILGLHAFGQEIVPCASTTGMTEHYPRIS
jgi:hypothetical protein